MIRAIDYLETWSERDLSPEGWYGNRPAVSCPKCSHVSPSPEHLAVHRLRSCFAPVGGRAL